jgi:hypothetical protein
MNPLKPPQEMSLEELRMLIEIRKLEMKIHLQEVKHNLGIGSRILKAIRKSGILESFQEGITQNSIKNKKQSPS